MKTVKNLNQLSQIADTVDSTVSKIPLGDLMAQLNQRALATALNAALQEDDGGPKCATTLRLPPDVNTFYRTWADVLGVSANQILEQVLKAYFDTEVARGAGTGT